VALPDTLHTDVLDAVQMFIVTAEAFAENMILAPGVVDKVRVTPAEKGPNMGRTVAVLLAH
jgi:hypothetical protein